MTLFSAEGIVRAFVRSVERGICHPPSVVHHAYLRWLRTQGVATKVFPTKGDKWPDGWLVQQKNLWARRAPGMTCVAALTDATTLGQLATNQSKGCGTVMRVAPAGLVDAGSFCNGSVPAFDFGVQISQLTHGHPTGFLAGGYLSQLFALLMDGWDLRRAVLAALEPLRNHHEGKEVCNAVERAVRLVDTGGEPKAETVESLGQGWIAEEALAIAIYCALVARDFAHGIQLSANISGDSDSTASITGQLLGTIGGDQVLPQPWREQLELHDVIERVARDLALVRTRTFDTAKEWHRYPGD